MADRSKLLELLSPVGSGDLLGGGEEAVGTDAIPTAALAAQGVPPPPTPEPEAEAQPGIEAIMGGPDMTPEERARLEMELALAARQRLASGMGING